MYSLYNCLSLNQEGAIATVSIDNGPINILDYQLVLELYKLAKQLEVDDSIKVIIFESSNPDFFIAHADVQLLMALEQEPEPDGQTPSMLQQTYELYRHMPKVTIGKIEGIARGGGSELLLALDMRFAAIGKARLGQPEAALGIIAGAGGCTRLTKLVGRGRAMEILLACEDFDAELAERYGYVNRAIPADEIGEFVNTMAQRIASYPMEALVISKNLVNEGEQITAADFGREYHGLHQAANQPGMVKRMQDALDMGLQTPEVEKGDLNPLIQNLNAKS